MTHSPAQYWDDVYSGGLVYDKKPSEAIKRSLKFLDSNRLLNPEVIFLELGCGYCRDIIYASRKLKGTTCYGIDISSQGLQLAKTLLEDSDHLSEKIKIVQEDAFTFVEQFPFQQAIPNLIYSHYLLQILKANDRDRMLEKTFQLLPPGGLLILSEYSINDSRFGTGDEVEHNTFVLYPEALLHTVHCFSQDELLRIQSKHICDMLHLEEYVEHECVRGSRISSKTWLAIYRKQTR
jgi:SAM-dependent methyltransferase